MGVAYHFEVKCPGGFYCRDHQRLLHRASMSHNSAGFSAQCPHMDHLAGDTDSNFLRGHCLDEYANRGANAWAQCPQPKMIACSPMGSGRQK